MAVIKRNNTLSIVFRPFNDGKQISLAVKDCKTKGHAKAVEVEIINALHTNTFQHLSPVARKSVIILYKNRQWVLPPELMPEKVQEPDHEFTLSDAFLYFVKSEKFQTAKYQERYKYCMERLEEYFRPDFPVKNIWVPEIKAYRMWRLQQGVRPATVNREKGTLSVIFQVLLDHRLVEANPCQLVPNLSEREGQRQAYIGYADIQRIISECPAWYGDIISLAYYTGMRRKEIVDLRWRGVNLERRIVTLHSVETKEAKAKKIPLHKDTLNIFKKWGETRGASDDYVFMMNGHKLSVESCKKPWTRALEKLNFPKPRPVFHDIRHTWTVNARISKIDHEIRQAILGHADRAKPVSERYGIVQEEELVEAIDKLIIPDYSTQILVSA